MPLPRLRPCLLALALAATSPWPILALAAPDVSQQAFDIPAGPLGESLTRIARQSGQILSVEPDLVRGRSAPAVRGQLTARQALQQVLAGSELILVVNPGGSWSLAPAPQDGALELGNISINSQLVGATTEGSDSYAPTAATLMKSTQPLRNIPQSVTVITRKQMDDQRLDTLDEVLANTPGINLRKRTGGGNDIMARGFDTNTLQYDGVPLPRTYSNGNMLSSSAVHLDRVEVLRGAQGLLEGSGSPAGSVNLVRKRGLAAPALTLEGRAGSWSNYGTRLDGGAPLNDEKTLRARAVLDYEDKHAFLDKVSDRNVNGYSAIDLDITADTTLGLGLAYSRLKGNGGLYYGVPRRADGTALSLPRKTNLDADWAQSTREETQLFFDLEHRINQQWKLRAAGAYIDEAYQADTAFSYFNFVPLDGRTMTAPGLAYDFTGQSKGFDLSLNGELSTFGLAHEVILGANYANQSRDDSFNEYSSSVVDTLNPNAALAKLGSRTLNRTRDTRSEMTQKGLYALWRLHLTDRTTLLLGSRVSDSRLSSATANPVTGAITTRSGEQENGEVTPFGGIVYELTPAWSAYASYAEIFEPQSALDTSLNILQPMTGVNYETGLKGELFEGALITSVALYRTEQKGRAVTDFESPRLCSGSYCSRAAGKVRSEGIEIEAHGELTDNIQINAGYTYNHNEYLEDANPLMIGKPFNLETPRHTIRLWSDYRLNGALSNWRVGLGVNYRSEQKTGSATMPDPVQGGHSIWNGRIAYEPNENWSAALNFENIFDKHYYSISQNYLNNHVGEPRNVLFSVRYKL